MDFTYFNSLPKDIRIDIAMCALTKILTGKMTHHLMIMERFGKDIKTFVDIHEDLIDKISLTPTNVISALKVLIEE